MFPIWRDITSPEGARRSEPPAVARGRRGEAGAINVSMRVTSVGAFPHLPIVLRYESINILLVSLNSTIVARVLVLACWRLCAWACGRTYGGIVDSCDVVLGICSRVTVNCTPPPPPPPPPRPLNTPVG